MTPASPSDTSRIDAIDGVSIDHEFVAPNGVELHYVAAGPADGDLVVCLHGFPEFWYSWHEQLPALADAGYRVVAPDLRGANRSGKPAGIGAYHLDDLAGDVLGVIHAFGRERARIVGHDFGGLVTWHLAHERPDAVERAAVCNCPHPTVFGRHLARSLAQLRKSWYVLYFQLPRLPEWGFAHDDYAVLESVFLDNARPGAITAVDVERFKRAFGRDGTPRAMVNWYRALFRSFGTDVLRNRGVPERPIEVPTLLCWGERDHALSRDLIDPHRAVVDDLRIRRFPGAGHWVQFDASAEVNETLVAFLSAPES